ncbi:MAG TPA: uracil-DNA glycosylase, partial [Alphaproteobacteria bacterium]|nr:uracil-DNA glycosylase [Alphaproteobacteria bacterium]
EIKNCQPFLRGRIDGLARLEIILALGKIAHDSVLRSFGLRLAEAKFAHGALHQLPDGRMLIDSYHCSRYNTNTGRLTTQMFQEVFAQIRHLLDLENNKS